MNNRDWLAAAQTPAIVGICKNAGKTSLLNYLIASSPHYRYGVMSTGIDGEDFDTVFKHPKPKVKIPAGSLFISDSATLEREASSVEVIRAAPGSSATRKLWILQAMRDLHTQITGASTVSEQTQSLELLQSLGANRVIIDGSLDRKSIATSDRIDSIFMAVGAGFGERGEVLKEMKRIEMLQKIEKVQTLKAEQYLLLRESEEIMAYRGGAWHQTGVTSLMGGKNKLQEVLQMTEATKVLYIPGAITESLYQTVIDLVKPGNLSIIVRHPDNLNLSSHKLTTLLDVAKLQTLIEYKISAFALNSWAPGLHQEDCEKFRTLLRKDFPDANWIDIMELA